MRSAPLVTLDRHTGVAIDELIDVFLSKHVTSEISKWAEETSYVWMTMVPLVHLAFATGKEYCCSQINDLNCDSQKREGGRCSFGSKQSETSSTEVDKARGADKKESQNSFYSLLSFDNREESRCHQESFNHGKVEGQLAIQNTLSDTSESMKTERSLYGNQRCVTAGRTHHFTWPGSTSTQKLGIFSLKNMLSFKENQQLALSENLLPYLVCLSWHLQFDEKEKLRNSLANFHNVSAPPSLKVISKSVLALVHGLDMVFSS